MGGATNDWKKWTSGACAAAALAIGGTAVTGAGAQQPGSGQKSEAEAARATPVTSVRPEQAHAIGELRRGRTTDDAIPSTWRQALADGDVANEHWGANPSLSRRTAPGVWIVPGDGHVCVVNATPGDGALGFGCASSGDVERGLLAPSDVDANGNGVLTGVLPDGIEAVTLVDRDGSTRSVGVARNTYRAAIGPDLKEVRFTGPDGARHVLPMGWNG